MELTNQLLQLNQHYHWWDSDSRLLLAVSGGLDSMVLLNLLRTLPSKQKPQVAVAHVNHQLRSAAVKEMDFLAEYCLQNDIPFFKAIWEEGPQTTTAVEAKAREFRYRFFAEILKTQNYDSLLTAHHGDDQAETILMKLLRGSRFTHMSGMADCRPFDEQSDKLLIRPLLFFSRAQLAGYAVQQKLPFMEDESNQTDDYLRNRLRHQVIPLLKQENPGFLSHIETFSLQNKYAAELVDQVIQPIYEQLVWCDKTDRWFLNATRFRELKTSEQFFLLQHWFAQVLVRQGIVLNQKQIIQAVELIKQQAGEKSMELGQNWRLLCSYQNVVLYNTHKVAAEVQNVSHSPSSFLLSVNEAINLSSTEWLTLLAPDQALALPEACKHWQKWEMLLSPAQVCHPLTVRHRQSGDRIHFQHQGYTKKLSRLFIDAKVPKIQRDRIWLVVEASGEIIWVLPKYQSYLSISKETDKIQYRLIYCHNENCLEGDTDFGK